MHAQVYSTRMFTVWDFVIGSQSSKFENSEISIHVQGSMVVFGKLSKLKSLYETKAKTHKWLIIGFQFGFDS